ncbi:MAG: 2-succinyl-6-hydroxy-2,4-cyclohexadiene-1-carboxylate synthase [Chloroflexi bacterium]|uniref:Putative 2-succinyl-6-hydroxy-2,4-cyclohexadiene-1-carboxylate synthase n=1 Tax=Candidatus Chlorohelix allophototropha TaxID=3003348 RepID=A0A8T7M7W0_9CHLR|nr:2-succinyl-6-hydroxy-2,4-cyclohexadiene-1-carboxylate synthase [Chloroflexota bacterium]WJW68034.1 2-succinyl-6-hydroxy-2,4-cyclohexadiene-1-carboxylate synthase [Chloroflexota bacterium L227-S17]
MEQALAYNYRREGHSTTLALLHGFTGSAASWNPHIVAFSDVADVLAVDAPGHGNSPAPADPALYSLPHTTEAFLKLLDILNLSRVVLLGYSMGGRQALHIATTAPERLEKLVLESATPGIIDPAERVARRESDGKLADFMEREGLETFVNHWENIPLFASQKQLSLTVRAAQRVQRLQNNPVGLTNSLRGAGTGTQEPLHAKLKKLQIPALLIAGELDLKFCAIAQQMHELIPQSHLEIVQEAGHTVHLEKPDEFDRLVLDFLKI